MCDMFLQQTIYIYISFVYIFIYLTEKYIKTTHLQSYQAEIYINQSKNTILKNKKL